MFGETLIVPATLYRSAGGDFEDKTLQFFVAQVDDKGKELNVLGGLELNLAEFASIQGHIRQEFAIECSSAVWGPAGGRPRLTLSIGAARGGERTADLAAAMSDLVSVDAMPSTLSTDEDDVSRPSSRVGGHNPSRSGLRSVREDAEELEDSDAARSVVGPTPPTVMQAHRDPGHAYDSDGFLMDSELAAKESPSVSQNNAASASPSTVKRNLGQEMDSVNVAQQMERLSVLGDTTLADEVAAHPDRPTHTRRFSKEGGALGSRKWAWRRQSSDPAPSASEGDPGEGKEDSGQAVSRGEVTREASRGSFFSAPSREHSLASGGTPEVGGLLGGRRTALGSPAGAEGRYMRELQAVAALESAVTYAGSSWARASSRPPKIEALQAPARRLARTIIVLGQEEGVPFGLKAFNAIRTAAAACLGDPHRMLLWWSNVVTLRWSLWALMGRGGTGGGAHFSWLSDPMMPALLQLEQALFDDLVDNLWTNVLLRAAKDSLAEEKGLRGRSLSRTMSNGSSKSATPLGAPAPGSAADGWTDGGAVAHWLRGLREVEQALTCPGRPLPAPRPLVALARRQALARILQRLDAALFAALVSDGAGGRSSPGALDPALLPFQRGPLTFGTGVELKMAAGRLANWAADVGLREGAPPAAPPSPDSTAATSPSGELRLFAQLRAAADLLMMPKGSLSDAEVRRTVAPSLSVDAICQVLQRYQPDDSSAERFSPAILNQLRREETPGNGAAASRGHFAAVDVYEAPAEDVLLNEGVIQPLSLELSADSDDELAAMEERAGGDSRFQLLRELWGGAGGRP